MSKLIHLLQLADPALPIGGFSHSGSLETYVQLGLVNDRATAKAYVEMQLTNNIAHTDAAFASLAYDATTNIEIERIILLDQECSAIKLPKEIREASQKLGLRLSKIFEPLTGNQFTKNYQDAIMSQKASGHYSLMFGMYAAIMSIEKLEALTGFIYSNVSGILTNAVKLIPLGQQDGQKILFELNETISCVAKKALHPDEDLIGLCCSGLDIRSMQHEQLYSRLYMS